MAVWLCAIEPSIKSGENGVVELKRGRGSVLDDFLPSYSAFANTDGGVIVLGGSEKNGERADAAI